MTENTINSVSRNPGALHFYSVRYAKMLHFLTYAPSGLRPMMGKVMSQNVPVFRALSVFLALK